MQFDWSRCAHSDQLELRKEEVATKITICQSAEYQMYPVASTNRHRWPRAAANGRPAKKGDVSSGRIYEVQCLKFLIDQVRRDPTKSE